MTPTHSIGPGGGYTLARVPEQVLHYGSHLLAADFRWLPVSAGAAHLALRRYRPGLVLPGAALLAVTGAVPQLRWVFLLLLGLATPFLLPGPSTRRRRVGLAMLLTVAGMIAFLSLLDVVTRDDQPFVFFRYAFAAYPAVVVGSLVLTLRLGPRPVGLVVAAAFIPLTGLAALFGVDEDQPDSTLAYVSMLRTGREAVRYVLERDMVPLVPDGFVPCCRHPSLGYVEQGLAPATTGSIRLGEHSSEAVVLLDLALIDRQAGFGRLVLQSLGGGWVLVDDTAWVDGPWTSHARLLRRVE